MKVLSVPHLTQLKGESGINTVVKNYFRHAADYGIEFVDTTADSFDLLAVHAGMSSGYYVGLPLVSHVHGFYWTADYTMPNWAYAANATIVKSIKYAQRTTVPSAWVAETIQRDFRFNPDVLPHGIEWEEWQHNEPLGNYVIGYAKNRSGIDVCNPQFLSHFARRFPDQQFLTTFAPTPKPGNVIETGIVPREDMKKLIQTVRVFVSTTKETWGITMLEAMAAGTPVLAFAQGGAKELVQHGVNGYLAQPNNYDDLAEGLNYCLKYRDTLGANARERAREFTWQKAMEKLEWVYRNALLVPETTGVGVVIPVYKKSVEELDRALTSCMNQTIPPVEIVVANDGTPENLSNQYVELIRSKSYPDNITYIRQENSGVAIARNTGIESLKTKYIVCLDADDELHPQFIEATLPALEADKSLGIAYTGLMTVFPDGREVVSQWPEGYDFEKQLNRKNQVPTACMFRREGWERTGGYRQRFAPDGAGAEDAQFWLTMGAYGYGAVKTTDAPLFRYHVGGQVSGNPSYREVDWTSWSPWTKDGFHPLPSVAKAERYSHPARQYDEPIISVVIPVGPGHEEYLFDALDSLDAQTFRKWEAIVVLDTNPHSSIGTPRNGMLPEFPWYTKLKTVYPYARLLYTAFPGGEDEPAKYGLGAGVSRNLGVMDARAPLIAYLDADDTYHPTALQRMFDEHLRTGNATYGEHFGIAYVENPDELQEVQLVSYNSRKKLALTRHKLPDYDCQRAMTDPERWVVRSDGTFPAPYLWCNINTLIRKEWHDKIGGFDENMQSWEDVLYWYRMAWSGVCFTRIPEPLMVYRFTTGSRREQGGKMWGSLIDYLKQQWKEADIMPCPGGCGGGKNPPAPHINDVLRTQKGIQTMDDKNLVLIRYDHPNRGEHAVYGPQSHTFYGYRAGGESFLVQRADMEARRDWFVEINESVPVPTPQPVPPPKPVRVEIPHIEHSSKSEARRQVDELVEGGVIKRNNIPEYQAPWIVESPMSGTGMKPEKEELVITSGTTGKAEEALGDVAETQESKTKDAILDQVRFDLQTLPGITPTIERNMKTAGYTTPESILKAGPKKLAKDVNYMSEAKAKLVVEHVRKVYGGGEKKI